MKTVGTPLPAASRPRGRQRSVEAEAAVLKATLDLCRSKPLRDVTADAIAQRAGVSKATLYKWWPNKSLIALDAFLGRMQKSVPIPDTGSARADFTAQLKDVIRFYLGEDGQLFRQFLAEGQSDPEFLALFRERFLRARREDVRIMWARGIARGEIQAALDEDIVLDLIYGATIFRLLAGHAPLDDLQAEAMVSAAFSGIAATPPARKKGRAHA